MTVIGFIEEIGNRFSKNHEKSPQKTLETLLNKKGWNVFIIILMIPIFFFMIGFIPFLLVLIGISLGVAFLLNGMLYILLQEKLNYDYDKCKYYIEWILVIITAFSSVPLFIMALTQVSNQY